MRVISGGEILSQRYSGHKVSLSVTTEGVTVALGGPGVSEEARVSVPQLLDNKWHTIQFLYQLGNLNLIVDKKTTVICKSNCKMNVPLLSKYPVELKIYLLFNIDSLECGCGRYNLYLDCWITWTHISQIIHRTRTKYTAIRLEYSILFCLSSILS